MDASVSEPAPVRLSILIPTIKSRAELYNRLIERLRPQCQGRNVEVLTEVDDGEVSIGVKRNALMKRAIGEWVCFVDDDDLVADDYVPRILAALDLNPDCVGFYVTRYVNGKLDGKACHSIRYHRYATINEGPEVFYERTPNHLNPIRRELAARVPFPELNNGEDTAYARRIYPLLESEVFIDANLYDYLYVDLGRRKETTNETRKAAQ